MYTLQGVWENCGQNKFSKIAVLSKLFLFKRQFYISWSWSHTLNQITFSIPIYGKIHSWEYAFPLQRNVYVSKGGSEGTQRREIRQSSWPETKEREIFSMIRKQSNRTISLLGKCFLSRRMYFLSWEDFIKCLVSWNFKLTKWYMLKYLASKLPGVPIQKS